MALHRGEVVLAETAESPIVGLRTLMGGTLTGIHACGWRLLFSGCGGYIDTLLGPEGTRECFSLGKQNDETELQSYRGKFCCRLVLVWVWFCVLFENCTVDASIFVVSV